MQAPILNKSLHKMEAFKKETLISYFLPFIVSFFSPIVPMILLVGFLLTADIVTGIWASRVRNIKISSHRMGETVTKMILYSLAIIIARSFEWVFFQDLEWQIPMASITAGYLALVEIKSNYENISYITGVDLWTMLRNRIETLRGKDPKID